jgi:LPXTG-motif cell wall-anchored protein
MRKYLWWIAAAVLALGLVAQFVAYRLDRPGMSNHAVWAFQPETFADVVNNSQLVVTAEVVRVDPGADIVVPAKGEPTGESRIPTQRITVRVESTDKGAANAGQELVIFHTGGVMKTGEAPPVGSLDGKDAPEVIPAPAGVPDAQTGNFSAKGDANAPGPDRPAQSPDANAPADAGIVSFMLDDDPAYQPGERYLLALVDGPEGTLRPISPEGRYLVAPDNSVQAVTTSAVGASVNGQALTTVNAAARGETVIPTQGDVQKRVTTPGMPTTGQQWQDLLLWAAVAGVALLAVGALLRRRKVT